MYNCRQSRWSCRLCSQRFPTSKSLRADLQAHEILVRDLLTELEKAEGHSQFQPLSSSSEDEDEQSQTVRTKTASKASSGSNSQHQCPYIGCTTSHGHKRSLRRHYTTHISINEKCGFCEEPFGILRKFVKHLDKNCKVKKKLEEKGNPLNEEQRKTFRRKEELCSESTRQLNQRLNTQGTTNNEGSVAGGARSYNNSLIKGGNEGATPESLASRGRIGSESDRGSTKLDNLVNKTAMRTQEQRPLQKRRRTDTHVIQSDEQKLIEDERAEAQLSSREYNDDQDKAISLGTVIVAENLHPSTSSLSDTSLTNTTLVPTMHIPSQTVRNLHPEDLFSFLTAYHGGCAPLAIQLCPDDLSLLPSIEVKFGLSNRPDVKIVFARQACFDLIEHVIQRGKSELDFSR